MDPSTFTELVPARPAARVFTQTMRPALADCAPSGRIRLDALARWLQDVAYADVEDAGLAQSAVWVVRRTRLLVSRFPRFAERFTVTTFCSGLGKMWATMIRSCSRSTAVNGVAVGRCRLALGDDLQFADARVRID